MRNLSISKAKRKTAGLKLQAGGRTDGRHIRFAYANLTCEHEDEVEDRPRFDPDLVEVGSCPPRGQVVDAVHVQTAVHKIVNIKYQC